MPEAIGLQIAAAVLWGLCAAGVGWVLLELATRPRTVSEHLGPFEVSRRQQLRTANALYRWFEPWIDELAPPAPDPLTPAWRQLQRDLAGSGDRLPWLPGEFLATQRVAGILVLPLVVYLGYTALGPAGVLAGLLAGWFGFPRLMVQSIHNKTETRRQLIKRRMSSALDLLALVMDVGGTFAEGLQAVARENAQHPLGQELGILIANLEGGSERKQAFQSLAERIVDDDVDEFVQSVVKGEELGTPLAKILSTQAEQMRQKRSQWAEQASARAQVNIIFPVMLIMVACLLIVAAPFVIRALVEYNS